MNGRIASLVAAALLIGARPKPEMWVPDVTMVLSADGASASFIARTRVPSPCYVAAGTAPGPPPGLRGVEHRAHLQLLLRSDPAGGCAESETLVEHRLERIDLAGKIGINVYVVLDGKVMSSWGVVWKRG